MSIIGTSIEAAITYQLPFAPWTTSGGDPVLIDRVNVRYVAEADDEDGPYFSARVHGWRANASGSRDGRQKDRTPIIRGRSATIAFIRETLGIDYEADLAELLATGIRA